MSLSLICFVCYCTVNCEQNTDGFSCKKIKKKSAFMHEIQVKEAKSQ